MAVEYPDIVQGSREWWALRLGTPTVSRFRRILTEKRLEYSKGADAFAAELLAERVLGEPADYTEADTMWTGRGTSLEDEARRWYAFYRDVTVREVGFVTTDSGGVGCSPDGLVDDDPSGEPGGVEIKCRSAKHHMGALLGLEPIADRLQVQGSLWVTGRAWWDVIAYNPKLRKRIHRVRPDPEVFGKIEAALDTFLERMERAEQRLAALPDVIEDDEDVLFQLIASVKAGASEVGE